MSTPNPFLKQLLSEISSKASVGRLNDYSWSAINEAKKKKKPVKEANMAPKKDDEEENPTPAPELGPKKEAPATEEPGAEAPSFSAPKSEAPGTSDAQPEAPAADVGPSEAPPESAGQDAGQAQDDATAAKAELEKAKAEKDQAEKEIKKQSYVHLISSPGVYFLLGKIVDHAFKTNSIDALASEMTNKLKIQTPEDFANFTEEMAPFKAIPGVAELLSSMKGMAATKQPDSGEESA